MNDLQSCFPEIAKEWDYERNEGLTPDQVAKKSNKSYWWKCSRCGHGWKAPVCDRAAGENCPKCDRKDKISLGEKALAYYLEEVTEVVENYHDRPRFGKMELDIFLPEINIAVEYDGRAYHSGKKYASDVEKNRICSDNGITLIRVRETGCPEIDGCMVIPSKPRFDEDFNGVVTAVLEIVCERLFIVNNVDVNIRRDSGLILEKKYQSQIRNSLASKYPLLARELHPIKNGALDPRFIPYASNQVVWWLGPCGHEWDAMVIVRTKMNQGCPICGNKRILKGFNDMVTTNPELAKEWDYEKNAPMVPEEVFAGTSEKYWWKCSLGHSWKADTSSRKNGRGCPVCSNKKLAVGVNDLKTRFPGLAAEWHPTLNGDLLPQDVVFGTNRAVWWKGECGHEWKQKIIYRTLNGLGCTVCNGKNGSKEFNLFTECPKLKDFWDPDRNELDPLTLRPKSNKKAFWRCSVGHTWEQEINRFAKTQSCPFCTGCRVLAGINDVQTLCPELMSEWNFERNEVPPSNLIPGSHYKAWWKCRNCGRDWQTMVYLRTRKKTGCPHCARIKSGL